MKGIRKQIPNEFTSPKKGGKWQRERLIMKINGFYILNLIEEGPKKILSINNEEQNSS